MAGPDLTRVRRHGSHRLSTLLFTCLAFAASASPALAAVLHVPADFPTIQSAISNSSSGDEIIVAPETYNEAIDFFGLAINLHSSDGPGKTIIDGTGYTTSVVRCVNGEGPGTILNGFTITGGHFGTPVGCCSFAGLGMAIFASSPTVTNCIFTGNSNSETATSGGGIASLGLNDIQGTFANPTISNCQFINNALDPAQSTEGAGIFVQDGNPVITGCIFSGNTAAYGAAASGGGGTGGTTVSMSGCTFSNNGAAFDGGGIRFAKATGSVTNSTFTGNTASISTNNGGGGIFLLNSDIFVTGCQFISNQGAYGSGMLIDQDIFTSMPLSGAPSPTVLNCTFSGNTGGSSGGGGIAIRNSLAHIEGCVFQGNTTGGLGGGLYSEKAGPTIVNCLFRNNSAVRGGGLLLRMNSGPLQTDFPIVSNCTVLDNTITTANNGAGIQVDQAGLTAITPARISNCIVRGNTGLAGSTNIRFPTASFAGWITLRNSDVQGSFVGPFTGSGNIDADPMFVDAANGDYHLQFGSPCIDSGHHWDLVIAGIEEDFDGNARLLDGNGDGVTWADMGMFEYQGTAGTLGEFPLPYRYWHFNDFIGSNPIPADLGVGTIDTSSWPGTISNGIGAITGAGAFFDINRVNDTPAGTSLQLLGGSTANNGSIKFAFSMSGRQNLKLSFVGSRSHSTTFNNGAWAWSTDGANFTTVTGNTCPSTLTAPYSALQTVDFSSATTLNNAPSVTLRYTLSGASGGADRFTTIDNVQLNVTPIPNPADITGDGVVNVDDLLAVINHWGVCPTKGECIGDIAPEGGNGVVDVDDLLLVINNWT